MSVIVACSLGQRRMFLKLSDLQKEYAQYFADLGVDVVIGNHPHQIQPIEKINQYTCDLFFRKFFKYNERCL